jgi:hypothetical protein
MKTISYHRRKFFFIPLALAAIVLFALVTMLLWNALLPALFNFSEITFWQAAGLLILARLFFGGMHPRWNRRSWHTDHELRNKIAKMSPEERKEFFRKMHYNRAVWCRESQPGKETEKGESGAE